MARQLAALPVFMALALLSARIATAEETVLLKFGWPDVVKAKVTLETTIIAVTNSTKHTLKGTSTYILEAARTSDGLLISEKDHRYVKRSYDGREMNEPGQWLPYARELAPLGQKRSMWKYLVSKEGTFVDLHDFVGAYCEHEAMRFFHLEGDPKTKEIIAKCRKRAEEKNDSFLSYIQQSASNQALRDWTRIVGWWAGGEMVEREIYESRTTLPEDVPPEKGIPIADTSKFVGRIPCKKGGPQADCARLEWVELLDTGNELRPLMEMIDLILPALKQERKGPDSSMGSLRRRTAIHLLTDPTTLLPYWVEEIESIRVVVDQGLASPTAMSTETHSIWTYEYEVPK